MKIRTSRTWRKIMLMKSSGAVNKVIWDKASDKSEDQIGFFVDIHVEEYIDQKIFRQVANKVSLGVRRHVSLQLLDIVWDR
jgi:hypothetical protein